jgi:hypothetical protein
MIIDTTVTVNGFAIVSFGLSTGREMSEAAIAPTEPAAIPDTVGLRVLGSYL